MKNIKKSIALLCVITFLLPVAAVYGYDYPNGFWDIEPKYEKALNSNNYSDIIKYGTQIIRLMENKPDSDEKRKIMVSRYDEVGKSYAALKEYDSAADIYRAYNKYVSACGDEYAGRIRYTREKAKQYTSEIKMYTDNGEPTYYGAKNEKKNGVLFGICAGAETRNEIPNESMILAYQELGQEFLAHNRGVLNEAAASDCAVEFALNCPKEADDIRNIKNLTSYLKEVSDTLKKYPDIPIYLRFAAEFDIWENLVDADSFKSAFRYVSSYFKERNPNVAIVWSPNASSNGNVNADDYYPGDEYVDWVGVSLYAQPYFLSDKTQEEGAEIIFKTGINSEPVLAIKELVEKYGNRKPIMISESGCAHKDIHLNEDTTGFALRRLKEYYSYLPMVYPQIKLMAYFDNYVYKQGKKPPDFRLSTNSALKNEYLKLTKGARFIQDSFNNNVSYCYRPVSDGTYLGSVFPVSCYVHSYNNETKSVNYYIDDKYVGTSKEIPFSVMVDASKYSGQHTLKAVASLADGKKLQTESTVSIGKGNDNISVEISGDRVSFDQNPIIYNDRTMVPMRKIFEELGATVSWDQDTQTATGKKGDRTVRIQIGQYKMYVNSKEFHHDTPPFILADRTLVPVRAVAEGLGCIVEWEPKYSLVSITPKVFKWSDWMEKLPDDIDDDLYYIEKKKEYRYREMEYCESTRKEDALNNYVRTDYSYGSWSDWQNTAIQSSDDLEIQTRIQDSPKRYHYAHWCTGKISDENYRYRTSSAKFHDEAVKHDLGWFDYQLPYSEDSTSDYAYYIDGVPQRCPNSCYRWYLVETDGGTYTQYRSRPLYKTYIFWRWKDWSDYSERDPYRDYDYNEIDVEERTVYRYKEK